MAGVQIRTSHPGGWTQCRQRGGSSTVHSLVMLDLASSDALTSDFSPQGRGNAGTQAVAGSPLATVLPATGGLTHGRLGVVVDRAATDNQLGLYELGERGDGAIVPVAVEALVYVTAGAVAGAALQVADDDGIASFVAGGPGATFATLLDDGTVDNGKGPLSTLCPRWVVLYSGGLPVVSDLDTADIADGAVTLANMADDSVGSDELIEESVLRSHFAPAAGMPMQTRAALFEPGIAGSMQRCSFSFDPTNTTDRTVRFKRRGLSLPAASAAFYWAGQQSADILNIRLANTAGVYTVELRENAATLATYTWTDDLEEHEWTFATTAAGSTITLDGASVATGTAPTFVDTSATFYIAHRSNSAAVFESDHALYRDVEVIDPATATNKVYLRLDEPAGGPYRNAYLTPGDPLYDASNTSAVTVATTGTDTTRPRSVEVLSVEAGSAHVLSGGRATKTRQAAFGGLGDAATGGQFGLVSWAPTGTPAFNVEIDLNRAITQGGDVVVWGRVAAEYANINVTAAGVVQARVNTTNICTTTVAALPNDGRIRGIRVEFRDSGADVTATIKQAGKTLVTGTLAATQFNAAAANHYVGGNTGARRYAGAIARVLLEDLNAATNSAEYLMTERTGDYANTYSGGTLASLTRNGYVGCCAVESEDGKGTPWQVGSGVPYKYGARLLADVAGITGVTTYPIVGLTEDERDPTGHYAAGVFTAPCAGVATFYCSASLAATTLAGADDVVLTVTQSTSSDVWTSKATLAAANEYAPMTAVGVAVMAAAQTLTASIESLLVGDVYTLAAGSAFVVIFTPDPATG